MDCDVDEVLRRECQPRDGYDAEVGFHWFVFPLLPELTCRALAEAQATEKCWAAWSRLYHQRALIYHEYQFHLHQRKQFDIYRKQVGLQVPDLEALDFAPDPEASYDGWQEYKHACPALTEHWMSVRSNEWLGGELADARDITAIALEVIDRGYFDEVDLHLISRKWFLAACPIPPIEQVRALRQLPYNKQYLHTAHWQRRRAAMLLMSGLRCALCRPDSPHDADSISSLNVHHHTYDARGAEEMPDLQVLCRRHHLCIHGLPGGYKSTGVGGPHAYGPIYEAV